MNFRLVAKQLAIVAMLIGGTMAFSLPWAWPALGHRTDEKYVDHYEFETAGFVALAISIVISVGVGGVLWWFGKNARGHFYRKEAMAVVGLSWVLATLLGAVPFLLSGTYRSSSVRVFEKDIVQVYGHDYDDKDEMLLADQVRLVELLLRKGARGLSEDELTGRVGDVSNADPNSPAAPDKLRKLAQRDNRWAKALIFPEDQIGPPDRRDNYRVRWRKMNVFDALFESQSGFSTTGATVISDLEDPYLVPRCILFWRSSTHFLGGLGIIVLFVAILGQGSAGKALMRAEMPGPSKEGSQTRMQHTALTFAVIYAALNAVLALLLMLEGMSLFDALCHAFGTLATGGFSTYNASLGHFQNVAGVNAALMEYTVVLFMIIAGTNFTLLYFVAIGRILNVLGDIEFRVYLAILLLATVAVVGFGHYHGDFKNEQQATGFDHTSDAVRYSLFQVVSIMTTTGYGTHDFDAWNSFGRGLLFLLMFVGGCAGSTGGGLKVIRHILFHKILWLEAETAFRPTVVRPLRLGANPVDDPQLRHNILVYFGLILFLFVISWIVLLTIEPDRTWGGGDVVAHKLIDSASAVAATLNNIGPGLGTVGATKNYTHFSPAAKLLFTVLMMIGRLEIFPIIVLFVPGFWRARP